MNFEQLKRRPVRTVGLAVAVGLAALTLGACGNDGSSEAAESKQPEATETVKGPGVEHTYYDDGSRLTDYTDDAGDYADVWAYCDGPDMVEQTAYNGGYKAAAGNSIERSTDHLACADGMLTPSDFKIGER